MTGKVQICKRFRPVSDTQQFWPTLTALAAVAIFIAAVANFCLPSQFWPVLTAIAAANFGLLSQLILPLQILP
jgi:hypothetical protein